MKEKIKILMLTGVLLAGIAGTEARAEEQEVWTTEISGITFREDYEKEKDPDKEEPGGSTSQDGEGQGETVKNSQAASNTKKSLPQTGEENERSRQTAGLVTGGSLMALLCRNKKR